MARNVAKVAQAYDIDSIRVPARFRRAIDLVQSSFPSITIHEYDDDSGGGGGGGDNTGPKPGGATTPLQASSDDGGRLEVPLNSVIVAGQAEPPKSLLVSRVVYPWEFLRTAQLALQQEVTEQCISPSASVARTAIIDGPCVIEDGAAVDDFSKIKGPTYIGKKSFVGMTSLVRGCMLGENTRIGFNCEVAKTYFAGDDKTSHQNVILDSVIGRGCGLEGTRGRQTCS